MAQDIHNTAERVENAIQRIKKHADIGEENEEDAEAFTQWMRTRQEMSNARVFRYLNSLKKVLAYEENDLRLKAAGEDELEQLVEQINDSAYYHKEYAAETKKEYKKLLRTYMRWANDGELPRKAAWIKATVNETDKQRTAPQDLYKPEDIKQIARYFDKLRRQALLLTHYDLGTRIGETLSLRVKDFFEEDGTYYISVRGNKKSPDRTARVDVCHPIIQRWLDEAHPAPDEPDAYLFCRIQRKTGEEEGEEAFSHGSYRQFNEKLREAVRGLGLDCATGTHTLRKSRISLLKTMGMAESAIDRRVGHIPGSEVTRDYTRIADTDANIAYAETYGNGGSEEVRDIVPLQCSECGEVNAGFRDRCYSCNSILEEQWERETDSVNPKTEEMRELMRELMREEGLTGEGQPPAR